MTLPGIYLDEDAQSVALIEALRARCVTVVTTTEAALSTHTDEEQLRFATFAWERECAGVSLHIPAVIRNSRIHHSITPSLR